MKVSHETPLSMLEQSREFCDYSYALVHLFNTEPTYHQFFKDELGRGRTVYLDNSLFETETMFDHREFAEHVVELGEINPGCFYYIVPDALEESKVTMDSFSEFTKNYPALPGKSIGVVQGKTYEELKECYQFMSANADMIAISFDYSWYETITPNENKFKSWMLGRQYLIDKLIEEGVWNHDKKHHLLGCGLAIEFKHYKEIDSIVSCDTSNPIVMGMLGHRYDEITGLDFKESIKLVELFDAELNNQQLEDVHHNINIFKKFCS